MADRLSSEKVQLRAGIASGTSSVVAGGDTNTASGFRATVPVGVGNLAAGDHSFAAGRQAKANNPGCFVWGDSTQADVACNNNHWVAHATGGVYFYTNSGLTSGMYLSSGGSSWNAVSDRKRKQNFSPVDRAVLLERLAEIQIGTWNYRSQDPSICHIGPMADEFNALLPDLGGEGEDYINTLDADGIALAAAQALYQLSQEQAAEIQKLQSENARLHEQLSDLEERLSHLEGKGVPSPTDASFLWYLPLMVLPLFVLILHKKSCQVR